MEWILALFLGLGLAASCGLNTFLPLLCLSGAAHWNLFGVSLGPSFSWLGSGTALTVLSIAVVAEVIADKIPTIDHALDVVATLVRPAAGALAAASAVGAVQGDATTAAVVGLIVGAPPALGVHAAKASTRAASSATTLGVANPVLSLGEDVLALGLSLLALAIPLAVPFALAAVAIVAWKIWKGLRARVAAKRVAQPAST
jgi:hypothetical protein